MKKGDIVTVQDSSYSRIIIDGELTNGQCKNVRYRRCVVVEMGCKFPKTSSWKGNNYNNTVVQDLKTNEVIFIEERFLQLATHTIVIDGKTIELSHESYLNLKEQLV